MKLKCRKCGKIWEYKGKKKIGLYTSCPDCHSSVKIKKLEDERREI